jgi:TolA-binding protein
MKNTGHEFPEQYVKQAREWVDETVIPDLAKSQLRRMQELARDGKIRTATELARSLEVFAAGTDLEPKFRQVLGQIEATARSAVEEAEKMAQAGETQKAIQKLGVVASVEHDAPVFEEARAKLAKLRESGTTGTTTKKGETPTPDDSAARQRKAWLSLAKNLILNQKESEARRYLELIVKNHPGSPEATEADRLLRE